MASAFSQASPPLSMCPLCFDTVRYDEAALDDRDPGGQRWNVHAWCAVADELLAYGIRPDHPGLHRTFA